MNHQETSKASEQARAECGAAHGSTNLTLASLAAIAATVPAPPQWRFCTMTPEGVAMLNQDPAFRLGRISGFGIEILVKPGQVAGGWMFSHRYTMLKYLAGELSELDLMGLMETGVCQPTVKGDT